MDEGSGIGTRRAAGWTGIRKCNLVAQAHELTKEEFKHEVFKHLTGKDTERHELLYFKVYKSQLQVIEQALETASLMLGGDKPRGYCLEMIAAEFPCRCELGSGRRRQAALRTDAADRLARQGAEVPGA